MKGCEFVGIPLSNYSTLTDEIKNRLDITDVISEYVTLTRKGRDWWGLCPFHEEKTASFSVSPSKQIFNCFGCNQGGDIFDFIMFYHKVDFKAARDLLAARAGLNTTIDRETRKRIAATRRQRQREKAIAAKLQKIINDEIKRLVNIEQWANTIIDSICTEECLDRPAVQWALQVRDKVGYYLDELQMADAARQLELINESRGAIRWIT